MTPEIEQHLEGAKRAAGDADQAKTDKATAALKAALPLPKNSDAIDLLIANGLTRNAARRLIHYRTDHDWNVSGSGSKGDPVMLMPLNAKSTAGIPQSHSPTGTEVLPTAIPAAQAAHGRQESTLETHTARMAVEPVNSRRSITEEEGDRF